MNKKSAYPELFDVFQIEYDSGCKSLAFAPPYQAETGDRVITTCGTGTVKASVKYCTLEDEWFKLVSGIYPVDRINYKIIEVGK